MLLIPDSRIKIRGILLSVKVLMDLNRIGRNVVGVRSTGDGRGTGITVSISVAEVNPRNRIQIIHNGTQGISCKPGRQRICPGIDHRPTGGTDALTLLKRILLHHKSPLALALHEASLIVGLR